MAEILLMVINERRYGEFQLSTGLPGYPFEMRVIGPCCVGHFICGVYEGRK